MPKHALKTLTVVIGLLALLFNPATTWAEQTGLETAVVHLSKSTNDLHAVNMALKLATALEQSSTQVTLFLDLEGVRLADARQPGSLRWGDAPSIGELYAAFVKAGGDVLVCPHCATAAGIDKDSLRDGAEIGTSEAIVKVLTSTAKILDY